MSEEIYRDEEVSITEFFGGIDKGKCLQITTEEHNYIQLKIKTAKVLMKQLTKYLKLEK